MAEPEKKKEGGDIVVAKTQTDKKEGPNLIFMIVLVLNILVMVGVLTVTFLAHQKEKNKETVQDVVKGLKQDVAQDQNTNQSKETILYPLEQFIVNLAKAGGSRYLKVVAVFEISNDTVKIELDKRLIQIRDLLIMLFSSKTYSQIETQDGKEFLRTEIKNAVNGYLTSGKVLNVYFTQFVAQ